MSREDATPQLGVPATVVFDIETHGPCQLASTHSEGARRGLRDAVVFDAEHPFTADEDAYEVDHNKMQEVLIQEIPVVSTYSLHIALYALQNATPENIAKALRKLACSGDMEEHGTHDDEQDFPIPDRVPEPPDWERDY